MSEENNMEEHHIKSMAYDEPLTDLVMPDVLIPPPQNDQTKKIIEDEVDVAFKFAFVGAGQGVSIIA